MLKKTNFSSETHKKLILSPDSNRGERIKNRIEKEIKQYLRKVDKRYSLSRSSPLLFNHIKKFLLRSGKRIRPVLFIAGYLGFSDKPARGLYTSALSIELLHNFILVHDDIIDKSDIRREGLSMHNMLNARLAKYKHVKYSGQDLAIILGDIMYAMGIEAFLTIDENANRKEKASKKLIEAAVFTGTGEFLELLSETKNISAIKKEDIYKIYDLKTGIYSFATPLILGAMLAGAPKKELDKLYACGIYLGRAFQIKDDLSDIVDTVTSPCKFRLTDLREAKITILIWHAYNNSGKKKQSIIKRTLEKDIPSYSDLLKARKIIIDSGTISYANTEIAAFINKAKALCADLNMRKVYKDILLEHCNAIQ